MEIPHFKNIEEFEKWWKEIQTSFSPDEIENLKKNPGVKYWRIRSKIRELAGARISSVAVLENYIQQMNDWIEKHLPEKGEELRLIIADSLMQNESLEKLVETEGEEKVRKMMTQLTAAEGGTRAEAVRIPADGVVSEFVALKEPGTPEFEDVLSKDKPPEWARNLRETIVKMDGPKTPDLSWFDKLKRARQSLPLLGVTIGGYLITKSLGRGGMGYVCLGENPEIGKKIAVKSVLPKSSLPAVDAETYDNFVKRFAREARVLAGLSETNPHIVRITDAGEYEGIPYYCMEYLPKGVPKKTSLKEAVNIIYQAGCGLEAAHSVEFDYVDHTGKKYRVKGVTHRDIKPENLRIGVDGKVKVTDWGLAAIRSSEVTRLSRTGMIVGTPMYMSPEQIMGDKVDPKTDVFSLGLVFYELLTGTLPWGLTKKTMEEIQGLHFKLAGYPPELIKQARPSSRVKVPQAIDDIVYLMLQPDKKKRPTMTEVLDALRDYGKGEGSSSFGERLSQVDARIKSVQKERWWQRNKGKVVVGIILAAVIGVILTYLGTRETPQERRRKEAVALYNEHLALYRDAESEANRNPESALEKFKLFVQRVKDLQESNRDVEFESVEEKLSSAEEALKRLKREVESKRLRKEAEAKYEGLLKIFESAENDDKEGKETSAVGYQNFIEQAEALKKQYSDIEFKEIEALLEKARRRKSEYDSKISERKRQEEARKKAEEILKRVMLASSIEEKLKLYDEAIAADSSYALIYIQKGELLVSENRLEEALKVFEKGLEVAKQNSDVSGQALAHYKIGLTLWKDLMKQELALDHFKKIKELLPDVRNEMTIFADAIDAWQKCDFDKANGLFGEVLKLNPRMTDALFNRACVRVNKGDYDGAIEDCSKILELNPKDVWALRERGMVKRMKGDYEGAITDYSRILEFPEFSDDWKKTVWLFRAETYNQMGRYKESAQEYEKLVLLEPRNCNFWYEFARVCCKAGDKKRALEALLKMIEVDASGEMKKLVKGEPDFEPLRSDPTFKKLFLDEEPKPK